MYSFDMETDTLSSKLITLSLLSLLPLQEGRGLK